jgi:hypothetical protein
MIRYALVAGVALSFSISSAEAASAQPTPTPPQVNCVPAKQNPTNRELRAAVACLQKIIAQLPKPTPTPNAVEYGKTVVLRFQNNVCLAIPTGVPPDQQKLAHLVSCAPGAPGAGFAVMTVDQPR